jgi:hypothetical protein
MGDQGLLMSILVFYPKGSSELQRQEIREKGSTIQITARATKPQYDMPDSPVILIRGLSRRDAIATMKEVLRTCGKFDAIQEES